MEYFLDASIVFGAFATIWHTVMYFRSEEFRIWHWYNVQVPRERRSRQGRIAVVTWE